ncbi:MAG: NusA-like transcription termination signal-binding factor [Candidatus Thermoplasmatota archaeon]|jgi:N utilization substance protein A|nr:NusA-like transcription termination signal-binding factor [Candidatus Thermoplasmatota archaeon]MCL5679069.1 NusA-like transcription termination signal-binding factor [Candidatus Thermoplasmatota archaeon]
MKEITIDNKIMGYIAMFERISHVELKECLENDDMVLFIVGEKRLAEIFNRNKNIVSELKEKVNKHILLAESSRDLLMFVKNLFYRYGVKEIDITWKENMTDILVAVETTEIGKAIGKEGRNIKLLKEAVGRFFPIHSLNIKQ